MALILKDIYEESRQRFQLQLIAGASGLNKLMKWVYVAEDYTTADFLHGGELLITTGVISGGSASWLMRFLRHITAQHTCGLIINEGKYLYRRDITQEVLDFCDQNHFPLFLMPWWVHIYDITRDFYNRIFLDTRRNEAINQAFLNLIDPLSDSGAALSVLSDYRFPEEAPYYAAVFEFPDKRDLALPDNDQLMHFILSALNELPFPHYLVTKSSSFFLICQQDDFSDVESAVRLIQEQVRTAYISFPLSAGIGGRVDSLRSLARSYTQAQAALQMGLHRQEPVFPYENMGFFKLLLEVEDEGVLYSYVERQLGKIHSYDEKHNSNFSQTLYLYLIHNGSIQATAEQSFCHRNTINHRLHIMKDSLGYRLEDSNVCFELLAAFQVEAFLKLRKQRDINQGV